jgi:hypothetical protein
VCYRSFGFETVCYSGLCFGTVCYSNACFGTVYHSSLCFGTVCYISSCFGTVCYVTVCYSRSCFGTVCYVTVCYSSSLGKFAVRHGVGNFVRTKLFNSTHNHTTHIIYSISMYYQRGKNAFLWHFYSQRFRFDQHGEDSTSALAKLLFYRMSTQKFHYMTVLTITAKI